MEPAAYEAWYQTPRGAWIAEREFRLCMGLLRPAAGASLLDVGTGTGHFARRFSRAGLRVTGLDPDLRALAFARSRGEGVGYLAGDGQALPFADGSFEYCTAITSLCFVPGAPSALAEMWRVSRRGVLLGLLNRRSLLFRQKAGRVAYRGARWDDHAAVREWAHGLPGLAACRSATAIFFPGGSIWSRWSESLLPARLPWGGFLAVYLSKRVRASGTDEIRFV